MLSPPTPTAGTEPCSFPFDVCVTDAAELESVAVTVAIFAEDVVSTIAVVSAAGSRVV